MRLTMTLSFSALLTCFWNSRKPRLPTKSAGQGIRPLRMIGSAALTGAVWPNRPTAPATTSASATFVSLANDMWNLPGMETFR